VWKACVHRDLHATRGEPVGERPDARGRCPELGGVVMGEEQDAHRERERIERVYAGYRRDARRRRAWSAANEGNVAMREEVLRTLRELAPEAWTGEGRVLDAGCGTGWWLERLAREGMAPCRLVGVDLLAKRVRAARARAPGATVLEGDVRSLPLPEGSCALVVLFTVLSAMGSQEDVRAALRESRRVLAPGGMVAVWEPRVWSPNSHTRLVGLGELRAALGDDLRVRSVTLAPPLARHAGRLYGALVRVPLLRTHRLVVARPLLECS
jgi:SAM-dependent methyltransferase